MTPQLPTIPRDTPEFMVVFHRAMRTSLLEWAALNGYDIVRMPGGGDEQPSGLPVHDVRLPTYLAVAQDVLLDREP